MGHLALVFYRNPRMLFLLIGVVVAAGLTAIGALPRMEDPPMKPRAATIRTLFPGASAGRVETLVTEPLERELQEVEEIRLMRSGSRRGYSLIALELQDEIEDVETAWSKIRDKISDTQPFLPAGATTPEFDDLRFQATSMLISVRWTSNNETNWAILSRTAKDLQTTIRGVYGTEKVELYGIPQEEIQVKVDRNKLAAMGMTMNQLATVIRNSDAKVSSGVVQNDEMAILLEMQGDFDSLSRIAQTIIGLDQSGIRVRLDQIATIEKRIADPTTDRVLVQGQDAIVLACYQRPNRRIDLWTSDAEQAIQGFQELVTEGVTIDVDFRQTRYVMQRLQRLIQNLGLGALAVMLVVFVIMGWRGSLLVGLTLPLTCLAVLGSMWIFDIPLHQMSVTGIILALGLLIDNAIVVVDEVQTAINEGNSITESIKTCVDHLAIPLLGSTLTTVLAFSPLILMVGPAAEFVYSIASSVIVAILASYFFSMTIVPAIMGWLRHKEIRNRAEHRPFWVNGWSNQKLSKRYRQSLYWLFRHPLAGIALGAVLPVIGFVASTQLPEQFFPSADRDQFTIKLELGPGKTLQQSTNLAIKARSLIMADPEIARCDWYIGRSAPPFYVNLVPLRKDVPSFAQAFVQLKRGIADQEMLQRLQNRLQMALPMARVNVQQLQLGPPLDDPIEIRIFGPDQVVLDRLGEKVRQLISTTPHVTTTTAQLGVVTPVMSWKFDEAALRRVGLDRYTVANELNLRLDGQVVGSVLEGREELPVRLRLNSGDRDQTETIEDMTIDRIVDGKRISIPLRSLGRWELTPIENSIQRIDNRRVNEIRAQVETGHLPSVILASFEQRVQETGFQLPKGYTMIYGGEAAERDRAVGNLVATAPVLAIIMFSTIVLSFRSFRSAFLIGAVGMLSVGLGLLALYLFGFPFGFMAIVGTMGLVGVAINDSIVVLAGLYTNEAVQTGASKAVANVVIRCTRHVLATTLTTIAGFLPLLMEGGGFWPPLATSIAGGVGGATLLALYFIPSVYLLTIRIRRISPAHKKTYPEHGPGTSPLP